MLVTCIGLGVEIELSEREHEFLHGSKDKRLTSNTGIEETNTSSNTDILLGTSNKELSNKSYRKVNIADTKLKQLLSEGWDSVSK